MNESSPDKARPPSLRSALRQARTEAAEQRDAVEDLRQAEVARLEMLEDAIRPVVDQTPDDVELFDLGITHGDRPRLFLDMISFVDLGHDRRTFRFFQDTRHGRVLIAESEQVEKIVAAVTNYVARRLVEREHALAADWRSRSPAAEAIRTTAKANGLRAPATAPAAPAAAPAPIRKRGAGRTIADVFGFLLMTLGSITLCVGLYLIAQAGWEAWGRAFWEAHVGPAPF